MLSSLLVSAFCLSISPTPGDTLIAYYESVNLRNYQVSELYIVRTDSLILEVKIVPELILPVRMPAIEFRNMYHLPSQQLTSYMIHQELRVITLLSKDRPIETQNRYAIPELGADSLHMLSLYIDSTFNSKVVLSKDTANFHPLSLYYPEITTLPVRIENPGSVTTLRSVISDQSEKARILQKLQLDLENYTYWDEGDIRNMVEENFGVTYDQWWEMVKKMVEAQKQKNQNE